MKSSLRTLTVKPGFSNDIPHISVRLLRPAEFDYGVEAALIALPVCRVSAVSQDLLLIYWPAPSAQTNITRPPSGRKPHVSLEICNH